LLDANKTQQQIANDFGVTDKTIDRYKGELRDILATIAKMSLDELKDKDLDFLFTPMPAGLSLLK